MCKGKVGEFGMDFGYQVRREMAALKANDPEKYRAVIATVKVPRTALLLLVISETSEILV